MAIGLLIIWGIGQLARQLIQPKIVGDSVGMPPLPTLFLLYIGYKLGGVVGMIVAVPIGLIALTMYQELARQAAEEEAQKEAQKEARKEAFAKKQKEKKS